MAGYGNALLMAWLWLLLGCAPAPAVAAAGTGPPAPGPGEATYLIDGRAIALSDGLAVLEPIDAAAARTLVKVFGPPVWGDLDDSGGPDAALLLVVDRGGSGSFYYLAVAYNRGGVFVGSEAIFLGDRIAPQRLSIRNGLIMVDYPERLPQQAMTVPPSHRVTKYLLAQKTGLEAIPPAQGEGLFAEEGPPTLGVRQGRLAPCPSSPNCVSSQADSPRQQIPPFAFQDQPAAAFERLVELMQTRSDARVVNVGAGYLRVELRTTWFVDDAEFLLDPSRQLIEVRSASRAGYSDLGKNRRRLEAIRQAFDRQGPPE